MNKIRNAVRPFAYVSMTILTVLSAAQMMWGFAALCFSGAIAAVRTQDAFLRLAGVDVFALENEPLQQTIIEILVVALLCSCHSAWGAWAFSNDAGGKWSWKYPRDIRFGATVLNIIMLIGVMHCVGIASWAISSPIRCDMLTFVVIAVVAVLYVFACIGSCPLFVAFMLRSMQSMSILVAFIVSIRSSSVAYSIVAALVLVACCHLMDCIEPSVAVRWSLARQKALDWLGISIAEEQ